MIKKVTFIDTGLKRRVGNYNNKKQYVLDNQILKDSNYYIPMDEGELMRSGIRTSILGSGRIQWVTPYARRLYYNPQYNFATDRNPNARGLWFEEAKRQRLEDWKKALKRLF